MAIPNTARISKKKWLEPMAVTRGSRPYQPLYPPNIDSSTRFFWATWLTPTCGNCVVQQFSIKRAGQLPQSLQPSTNEPIQLRIEDLDEIYCHEYHE